MTDQTKIPAPEPCAQISGGLLQWYFPPADAYYPVDAKYLRGIHMLITLESAETYAAAREAAARDERAFDAHQAGVQAMADALRRILDGGECTASIPPELAEVARLRALLDQAAVDIVSADTGRAQIVAAARQEERGRCIAEIGALHTAQTVNNQNHPRAWHDAVDAALAAIRAG